MMRSWLLYSVSLLFISASWPGCANSPSAPLSPPHSTPVPVGLSATISQSVLPAGGAATITFRLENHGATDLELTFPSSCQIMPYISLQDAVIYPSGGGWGCATVITNLTVPAGGAVTRDVLLRASPTAEYPSVPLGAGNFIAYAKLDSFQYHVTSPLVPFTVQ
jgi:hypothetical protein